MDMSDILHNDIMLHEDKVGLFTLQPTAISTWIAWWDLFW